MRIRTRVATGRANSRKAGDTRCEHMLLQKRKKNLGFWSASTAFFWPRKAF